MKIVDRSNLFCLSAVGMILIWRNFFVMLKTASAEGSRTGPEKSSSSVLQKKENDIFDIVLYCMI